MEALGAQLDLGQPKGPSKKVRAKPKIERVVLNSFDKFNS